jgi:hypothetical protein
MVCISGLYPVPITGISKERKLDLLLLLRNLFRGWLCYAVLAQDVSSPNSSMLNAKFQRIFYIRDTSIPEGFRSCSATIEAKKTWQDTFQKNR